MHPNHTYYLKVINLSDIPAELRTHAAECNEMLHDYYSWGVEDEEHPLSDWLHENEEIDWGENVLIFFNSIDGI